ncbi:AMP-binding protein [Pseudodonghicola flavimaris]|uniref:AMP-binding protein n=1 Tax=Pseudodonghicola flavimaris TaxID=3050036 RepID=A0ABT7F3Y6_9RHOB|nr:AMP-binding protein [Pseudodonghicola flavimaris]MDK3019311.1 AMP-binding protein [Pseudodonghicola flavimaris]
MTETTISPETQPLSEAEYLARVRAAQAANWPAGVPSEPIYPHGEAGISDYLRAWAAVQPDKVLYNFYGGTITYGEMDRLSDRFAARLAADGVAPGDRVAVFMGNCPQFAIAFFGILKAGAVHVPVNPMFREHELIYELNDADAEVMVAADVLVPLVQSVRDRVRLRKLYATGMADWVPKTPAFHCPPSIVSQPDQATGTEDFIAALEACDAPVPQIATDLDAMAALNYTGGTTGMPKGCVHTQRHMIYTAATTCGIGTQLSPEDVSICFHPLFWIAGEDMGLLFPVFSGCSCILLGRWDVLSFLSAVDRLRPNQAGMLVDNAVEVMDHPEVGKYDLTALQKTRVSSFVKKLNHDYRTRWRELTGSVMAEAAWGMTETHTCDTFTTGYQQGDWDLDQQPVFVGMACPGTEFKICDFDSGALKPLGEEGEICVRSPSLLTSYWNKPEATAEAIRDGWLHTGDIGVLDQMGLLHFLGRRKEMLKVKGMSVFPAELEAMLGRHPAIIGSGVIGRPDPDKGQVPVAFVTLGEGKQATAAEIEAWCADEMAIYKRPEVRIVDALPMTATGKVKKEELAQLL